MGSHLHEPSDRSLSVVRGDDGTTGRTEIYPQPIDRSRVVLDADAIASALRVSLPRPEGGSVHVAGTIETFTAFPLEIDPGDYVHPVLPYVRALKVTATPRLLGAVVRLHGLTTDVGSETRYFERDRVLTVTRGFSSSTLPEQDGWEDETP